MIRLAASALLGTLLVFIQAWIVMKLNGYSGIEFNNLVHLGLVWTIDFFLSLSVITQMLPWLIRYKVIDPPASDEQR
jgi:uncharacterized membrane protein